MFRYDFEWLETDPAAIEMRLIQSGGYLADDKDKVGHGLFYHFKELQTLLWPEDDHHRWSDTILREYLANRITVIMGARDSSKTRSISKAVLVDYYCFPEETLILMTSTNIRGLELRVWGDIKSLHDRAKERYPWLAGNVADSKHGIFTDNVAEGDEVRDQRKGILCVPCLGSQGEYMGNALKDFCFRSGTQVDTPDGPVPIEFIKPGDSVWSALGESLVIEVSCRFVSCLVRLHFSDGRHVDCTSDHSFLTEMGWKNAVDILPKDRLVSTDEAMRILQIRVPPQGCPSTFLFKELCYEMEMGTTSLQDEVGEIASSHRHGEREEDKPGDSVQRSRQTEAERKDDRASAYAQTSPHCSEQEYGLERTRGKSFTHPWGTETHGHVSRSLSRFLHSHREKLEAGEFANLLVGLGVPVAEIRCRDGRILSSHRQTEAEGCGTGFLAPPERVDRVEILGPGSAESYRMGKKGYYVYNLSVEGHPSYSVCGLLVHNCGIKQKRRRLIGDELQFIPREYLKVLDSLDKGDFKAGFLGNPIADNGKALDAVSEPVEGWDGLGEVTKTKVWKNKYNGVTINLVGTDSPNFDKDTLNKFPYMVDQGDADRVAGRPGGKDSLEWWSQIMGVRKAGAVSNRVLTVKEIERYDGFLSGIWSGEPTVKVYSIDAGFGGDECVRTWAEFGEAVDGRKIIQFGDQKVIPILMSAPDTPEKQIAKYARNDCATLGIPAAHVFFDAGMYATLAVELAREMSPEVNAVNFGGTATERPVDNDTFVWDEKTQSKRLKTWYEHVSKFVTELWFVVRLLAQCRQARKFPREAAEEFGRRQWIYVSNNRYELETKDDYKLRNGGESPNHADSLVIAVEGARRLGFTIEAIPEPGRETKPDDDYLAKELARYRETLKKRALHYS